MDMPHWPTIKPVMLNDVTGRITFSTASTDPFMSVTCAQGEPALICEKHRTQAGPVVDLPTLVFYSMANANHAPRCRAQSTRSTKDAGPSGQPHEVCLWCFCQTFTPVAYWTSFVGFWQCLSCSPLHTSPNVRKTRREEKCQRPPLVKPSFPL